MLTARYIGGHPQLNGPRKGTLIFEADGVRFRSLQPLFGIAAPAITRVRVEGPEASAKKKKETKSYLEVNTVDLAVSFLVPGLSAPELRVKLGPWLHISHC